MNKTYRITDIRRATFNGSRVKVFRVWRDTGNGFVHYGMFSAPARTANKRLLETVLDRA